MSQARRWVLTFGVVVAVLASGGCGGGDSPEKKFSDKLGEGVTGCHEALKNHGNTIYQRDHGITGIIKADGTVQVLATSTGP